MIDGFILKRHGLSKHFFSRAKTGEYRRKTMQGEQQLFKKDTKRKKMKQ